MNPAIRHAAILIISLHFTIACDQQPTPKTEAAPTAIAPQTQPTQTQPTQNNEPKPAAPKAIEAKPTEAKAEETQPADKVRSIPFDQSKFPTDLPPGEVLGGFAFNDSAGENHVVFTLVETGSHDEGSKQLPSSVLRIKHVASQNDTVTTVRSYTERIENCEFDIILEPFFGEWSVSDVDQNGIGEASFAYTAVCVSDVSPLTHKAFVTEAGQKYTLRGRTYLQIPDEQPEGGEYTSEKMPPAFLTKAQQVWELTARR